MDPGQITGLILTFNEEANIARTLSALTWIKRILLVDSGSTDLTKEIAGRFPNVEMVHRTFDHFAGQCNFGLSLIKSEWTLSLDADYVCPKSMHQEILSLDDSLDALQASFTYCIYGSRLRGSLYPPRTVLYRTRMAQYREDGHAHRVEVRGKSGKLMSTIDHDDHKSMDRWVASQWKYATQEAHKLSTTSIRELGFKDRIRKWVIIAPVLIFIYTFGFKLLFLNGRAGLYYAIQRVFAELALSLAILDRFLRKKIDSESGSKE